jgi:uncharacterized protein YndB with AHSA1/START domain
VKFSRPLLILRSQQGSGSPKAAASSKKVSKFNGIGEMYEISIPATVKAVEPNKRIVIEWPGYGTPNTVEWTFAAQEDGTTFVRITNSGLTGTGDELVKQATDSTQGFTLVLAGLKALLEHNVVLNLVADRFPKGIEEH